MKRHKLATTTVDVYRLFKVRDAASVLKRATDGVINHLGQMIHAEAVHMLEPYCKEQQSIIDRDNARKDREEMKEIGKKFNPKKKRRKL